MTTDARLRIGTNLSSGIDFVNLLSEIVALEAAGLDVVWLGESYGYDSVSAMGALATKTEHVIIGSCILPIYSRTPALIAMTAAGVDAISRGRFILGLGASGPQVIEGWHGVPFDAPVGRTREIIDICRAAWRRDRLVHDGPKYNIPLPSGEGLGLGRPLKLMAHPDRERIPIFVAALGDANVAMAAEQAEGWLPMFFWPEMADSVWGSSLARGLALRDPSLPPLEIAATAVLAIGDNVNHLIERQRPTLAHYIGGMGARGKNFYFDLACRYGFHREATVIQDLYLDGQHEAAAAEVPADLLEHISLIGTAEHVARRIAAYRRVGVTILNVVPLGRSIDDRCAQVRHLRQLIDAGSSSA